MQTLQKLDLVKFKVTTGAGKAGKIVILRNQAGKAGISKMFNQDSNPVFFLEFHH